MSRRRRPGVRARTLRVGAAHLLWWSCALAGLLLGVAAVGLGLRADEGAQPWTLLFGVADVLTPPFLDGLVEPSPLSDSFAARGSGWAIAAVAWFAVGGAWVALVRPRRLDGE